MPLTFPTHPAAVLPLKLWRPRWFDGVALTLGSIAPDLAYVLDGSGLPVWPFSHEWLGLVGWCLPIVLLGGWLVRWAAPWVAVHLPTGGWLALRDYGALHNDRPRWWITVISGLIGAVSHLLLDDLEIALPAAEYPLHMAGSVAMVTLVLVIGRRGLLRRWHGEPPSRPRRPALFWTVAAVAAVPAIAVTPTLPGATLAHTTGSRLLCAIGGGLLLGAVAVSLVTRRSAPSRSH